MVFITSDNGGVNGFSNQGLRGKKSHLWEGGHRVPGIFRWPGKIEAGTECKVPVCGVDLLPTICEFTGGKVPTDRKLDGTSLASLLTGKSETLKRETPLYWFFYRLNPSLALRDGRWGLIADTSDAQRPKTHSLIREDMAFIKTSRPEKFLLFDLAAELPQQKDLSNEYPEVFERLKDIHDRLDMAIQSTIKLIEECLVTNDAYYFDEVSLPIQITEDSEMYSFYRYLLGVTA